MRVFCQAEGISEPSFYLWRRKLDQADHKKPAFLPVHVVTEEAKRPQHVTSRSSWPTDAARVSARSGAHV